MVRSRRILEIIEADGLFEHVAKVGGYFLHERTIRFRAALNVSAGELRVGMRALYAELGQLSGLAATETSTE
ncbi:MAG TPA: hypothetical protein VIX86_09005 [Streptosporangiaceae bacterium]